MRDYIPLEVNVTRRATVKQGDNLHTYEMSMKANILNPEHSTEVLVEISRTLETLIMEKIQDESQDQQSKMKVTPTFDEPITQKQKELFDRLAEKGMSEPISQAIKELGRESVTHLTKREASDILTRLLNSMRKGDKQ